MLKLIIEDDEGRKTVVPFVREEITIGRQEGNTIRLTERNVSRRHARLMRQNGHVVVEDLGSSNGTRINGERISGQSSVKDGDLIQIGDYDLALQSDAVAGATRRPPPAAAPPSEPDNASEPETELETPVEDEATPAAGADARRHSTAIINVDKVEGNRNRKVVELEAEEAPRLVVVSAELKGQEYACIKTEMKIGRTDDNDIAIDHRSLSRTHAKIVREDNGEWRILDMQSANGLTVNGETYAQAPLNHGDVIELGHVKLRFIGAGEAVGSLGSEGRSKLPLVLAIVVVLLAGGAGAAWALKLGPFKAGPGPQKPPEITQQHPPEPTPKPDTPPEPSPTPGDTHAGTPAEDTAKAVQAHLDSAQKAYDEGNFDQAADELKNISGQLPPEAEALATQIAHEQAALRGMKEAQDAFKQKKYDEAIEAAAPAKDSDHFKQDYDNLMASIEQERKPPEKPTPAPPTPKQTPPKPETSPEQDAAKANEQAAENAYADAAKLLKNQQYREAIIRANTCVKLMANNAECYLIMAASHARLEELDKASTYYNKFLELAPDHKLAPKVRQILSDYKNNKVQSK